MLETIRTVPTRPDMHDVGAKLIPVGIDLGYGYVKAVGPGGEVVFPALTTRLMRSSGLASILTGDGETPNGRLRDGFRVTMAGPSARGRYAVGSLARLEGGGGTGVPLDQDRWRHEGARVLLAVAAALASGGTSASLAVATGDPPGHFNQKSRAAAEELLRGFQADVEFEDGPFPGVVSVRIAAARVFPQAAGGIFHALSIPGNVLGEGATEAGVVDIGYGTTDYMILDLRTRNIAEGMSGSLEVGTHRIAALVAEAYHAATGGELPLELAEGVVASGNTQAWWRGRSVDLSKALAEACQEVATTVYEGLRTKWRDRLDILQPILVMGGGGTLLGNLLTERLGRPVTVLPMSQMANAKGFAVVAAQLAR